MPCFPSNLLTRRKRDDSNGTVHYLGGYERKLAADANSSDTITKYYSASLGAMSRPVAFRRGGTLHWVGSDHLGGTIRVLNSSFTALDGMRYKPYGEDRDAGTSLNTDRKFTGQTEDEAAGLYWYASRAYDPAVGRFVSPDVVVPEPGNPQSLNRYSYVYNNPLGNVDPSGHVSKDWDQAWVGRFKEAHDRKPNDQDWADYQYSLLHRGSGPGGAWTNQDWEIYTKNKQTSQYVEQHIFASADDRTQLQDQAREDHLAESYSSTIRPPDPLPATPAPTVAEQPANPSTYIEIVNGGMVVNNAGGMLGDLLKLTGRERNTVVLTWFLTISTYNVSDYPLIMQHEKGHRVQAFLMGPGYLPAYGGGYLVLEGFAWLAEKFTGEYDPNFSHTNHPMEITANLIVGLPPYWRPSR